MSNFVASLQNPLLFHNCNTIENIEILPAICTYGGKKYSVFKVVGYIKQAPVIFGVFEKLADALKEINQIFDATQFKSDSYIPMDGL